MRYCSNSNIIVWKENTLLALILNAALKMIELDSVSQKHFRPLKYFFKMCSVTIGSLI